MGLGFLVALSIPDTGRVQSIPEGHPRISLVSPRWFMFLIVACLSGMALSMISNFLFIFLRQLGADEFSLGLTLTVATLSELPVLFFSSRLLSRWKERQLIGAALLFFVMRALAYSFIIVPWLALPIQLLHGPTFSLMWIAGVSYADRIAPTGMEATAQGLFSGVMLGIGSAGGAFLGGLFYEYFGLVTMFRLAALIAFVGLGLVFLGKKKSHEHYI
jgi:PPP family 3-phenylpropionic acid transporter